MKCFLGLVSYRCFRSTVSQEGLKPVVFEKQKSIGGLWTEDGKVREGDLKQPKTRWWFQIFFIFTPTWGNDPI